MSLKPGKKGDEGTAWNRTKEKRKPKINFRTKGKRFILFCEGRNTEPLYFKAFPVSSAEIRCIGKGGRSKLSLVRYGLKELEKMESYPEDEVWFIFDMDVHYPEVSDQKADFNSAIQLAQEKHQVAYSNDCLELWFVLHYHQVTAQLTRREYYEILSKKWDMDYEKEAKKIAFASTLYQKLLDDPDASQEEAIKRAKALWEESLHLSPGDKNPITSVFQLVEELDKHLN